MRKLLFTLILGSLVFTNSCHRNKPIQVQGYVEGESIYLASPFYGVLEELSVVRGQHVEKGQLLFRLDSDPQKIVIEQAQSDLSHAKKILADLVKPRRTPEILAIKAQIEQTNAQIRLAEIRLERLKTLYVKQAASKDTVDEASALLQQQQQLKIQYEDNLNLATLGSREDQIDAQKELVKSLEAKLQQAQWDLAQKTVMAPDSGIIFDTYYQTGELVGNQQPVVSLLTPKNIRIEFFIPLSALARANLGQKITFDCEGCESNNEAVISYISPDAEYTPPLVYSRDNYSKLVFRVKAQIHSDKIFKPGQPVVVTL